MNTRDIENLRRQIRQKDIELVRLLNERARLSVNVGCIKNREGLEVYDPAQERKILEELSGSNSGPLPNDSLRRIYQKIFSASRELQAPLIEACLGQEGRDEDSRILFPEGCEAIICISIVPASNEEAISMLKRALPAADLVELRIDRIGKPELPMLLSAGKERIVVTNRRSDEGGFFAGNENRRMALLHEAVDLGAGLVDIEAKTGTAAVSELAATIRVKGGKTRLIVSHHDMAATPTVRNLERRLKACCALGADIVKIVTLARTVEDNLRVLEIIPLAREMGQNITAFCMGERGRLSRVAAPLLGACISYASLEERDKSAPGQMTAAQMRKMMEIISP